MPVAPTPPPVTLDHPGGVPVTLTRGGRGVPGVLLFTLSAAAPLTVVAAVVPTAYAVTGTGALGAAVLVVAVVLGLFSVGYLAMSRRMTHVGAFHAYVARGLGRPAGVGAAWVALIAQNAVQVGLYGVVGAATAPLVARWFGGTGTWWLVALAAWALVAVLGVAGVTVDRTVLAALLLAEVAVLVVFDLAHLRHAADGTVDVTALSPVHLLTPGAGALLVVAAVGFVGFESAVLLREESRHSRAVPVATYLAVGLVGAVLAFSAWTLTVATGPDRVAAVAGERGTDLLFTLAGDQLGASAVGIGRALLVTSVLAALVSLHHTTARYAFALGRERLLPAPFGEASPRTGAPRPASVAQSALGLLVIVACASAGLEPVRHLFYGATVTGALGMLLLTAATSFAVLAFFAREATDENLWRRAVAPGLAAVALVAVVVLALADVAVLLGVGPDSPLRWAVAAVFPLTGLAGTLWAVLLRSRRPRAYARIGLGPESAAADLPGRGGRRGPLLPLFDEEGTPPTTPQGG
ncbi:Amino acid transporter [Micromonospora echinospora]|uniref:Amino acid transporter n=1 Tax=Micromonospora echinospora TaxID=1877 RepID=A0A1C4U592_MICEC|nr:Amino acid transporter [Micromonospora echinospora]